MVNTYQVLSPRDEVLGYFGTQHEAKVFCVHNSIHCGLIVKLRGQYFGEGWHAYKMQYNAKKISFKYVEKWGTPAVGKVYFR